MHVNKIAWINRLELIQYSKDSYLTLPLTFDRLSRFARG